jgi:hypothetical protein
MTMRQNKDPHWKAVAVQPILPKNQQPLEPFDEQRECCQCKGENFKILKAKKPKVGILGYFVICSSCGYQKWLQGDRNPRKR